MAGAPAEGQVSTAPAAAADAYGLFVDVELAPIGIPIALGPLARATQEAPPNPDAPDEAEVLGAGPIPAGGELVQSIGLLSSAAGAGDAPVAGATAQAVDVALLSQSGTPLITADLVGAVSRTTCDEPPNGANSQFVNLRVAGVADPINDPAPNTRLLPEIFSPLGLEVMLNEQHQAADGRGLVVNAIHIYALSGGAVPPLFTGDIIVAHAMSTVNCPNGAGTTGADNDVFIVKEVDEPTAMAGDTLTYTATVENNHADTACAVNRLTDHLPAPFEFVSTSGDFGTVATTENRPGGGVDVILKPADLVIEAGASATQTFVVKVKDDAAVGTYFNNVELLCGNLGNWVKGLDAPVEIVAETPATTSSTTPVIVDELPETGAPWGFGAGAAVVAAAALAWAAWRRACGASFEG